MLRLYQTILTVDAWFIPNCIDRKMLGLKVVGRLTESLNEYVTNENDRAS